MANVTIGIDIGYSALCVGSFRDGFEMCTKIPAFWTQTKDVYKTSVFRKTPFPSSFKHRLRSIFGFLFRLQNFNFCFY